jgi:putative FmdB family regulatory protein
MPIYEYRCASCGHQQEYLQRVSDPQLTDCPECRQSTYSKLVTAAGFQLKGNGWYVTDFRNNGAKPKSGGDKAGEGDKAETRKDEGASEPACGTGACPACT